MQGLLVLAKAIGLKQLAVANILDRLSLKQGVAGHVRHVRIHVAQESKQSVSI